MVVAMQVAYESTVKNQSAIRNYPARIPVAAMHQTADAGSLLHCANSALSTVVASIGTSLFIRSMLQFLNATCLAEHCALYRLEGGLVKCITSGSVDGGTAASSHADKYVRGQYWRKDTDMMRALFFQSPADSTIIRTHPPEHWDISLKESIYPHARDRLIVAGRSENAAVAISIVRTTSGGFSGSSVAALSSKAHLLLCAASRHAALLADPHDASESLDEVVTIEECLVAMTSFPRREVEVAARLLYGHSAFDISNELGVGVESVRTYRKRTYERLGIHNERGLLKWYLREWSSWRMLQQ